ncbi:MAG: hypothetical protein EOP49_25235 [Sphingobacteriales bacterium]|nr:MAG: hypothetical protein EOP49_25235 [Sphingobacteriales bacterium]
MEELTEEDVITTTQIVGNDMAMLREKAAIDIQVSTARAYPRDIKRALDNSIFTATIDVETAGACTYAVPRGEKTITGPSVHMAKIIMQNWGNFRGEAKVISEEARTVTSEAVAWDLETNVAVKVTVKRSIMQNKGKTRMNDDMITVTGNAANAIALRNAIFNVIPRVITDKVYQAVQNKIVGDEESFAKRVAAVFKGFKDVYTKTEADVLRLVGKKELGQITKADLIVLIGVAQALKDGDVTAELVFRENKTGDDKKAELKAKQDAAKAAKAAQAQEGKDQAAADAKETPATDQRPPAAEGPNGEIIMP